MKSFGKYYPNRTAASSQGVQRLPPATDKTRSGFNTASPLRDRTAV